MDHEPVANDEAVADRGLPATLETATEPCWRCGARMEWRHATLQCPRCRFKIGCCEGLTGECLEPLPR